MAESAVSQLLSQLLADKPFVYLERPILAKEAADTAEQKSGQCGWRGVGEERIGDDEEAVGQIKEFSRSEILAAWATDPWSFPRPYMEVYEIKNILTIVRYFCLFSFDAYTDGAMCWGVTQLVFSTMEEVHRTALVVIVRLATLHSHSGK